jgi:hypothetical protein
MQHQRRLPALSGALYAALLLGVALLIGACGQKGDLYLAEDDPQRAERDARGRQKPFPFPPDGADWPPPPGAPQAGAAEPPPAGNPPTTP